VLVQTSIEEQTEFEVREGELVKQLPGIRPKIEPDRLVFSAKRKEDKHEQFRKDFASN